mmetsp:Transcript_46058/g.114275  ORF Transcript_46058/g.114275 Transcript_46058/m.114275 type:complete len:224 (+) Transcript_46058:803-1474(+)
MIELGVSSAVGLISSGFFKAELGVSLGACSAAVLARAINEANALARPSSTEGGGGAWFSAALGLMPKDFKKARVFDFGLACSGWREATTAWKPAFSFVFIAARCSSTSHGSRSIHTPSRITRLARSFCFVMRAVESRPLILCFAVLSAAMSSWILAFCSFATLVNQSYAINAPSKAMSINELTGLIFFFRLSLSSCSRRASILILFCAFLIFRSTSPIIAMPS